MLGNHSFMVARSWVWGDCCLSLELITQKNQLFIGFVCVISIPAFSSQAILGHDYLWLCLLSQITLTGVCKCCWSLLWKFDKVEIKERSRSYSELHHIISMSENQMERPFFHFSEKKKKKTSFLFIKEAASLAGKNFPPLTRNINNASRREQRSHINHACMDIFYFKIIFLNLKNIHDCLIGAQ